MAPNSNMSPCHVTKGGLPLMFWWWRKLRREKQQQYPIRDTSRSKSNWYCQSGKRYLFRDEILNLVSYLGQQIQSRQCVLGKESILISDASSSLLLLSDEIVKNKLQLHPFKHMGNASRRWEKVDVSELLLQFECGWHDSDLESFPESAMMIAMGPWGNQDLNIKMNLLINNIKNMLIAPMGSPISSCKTSGKPSWD